VSDLTPTRIAEIRSLAEKATPGPWESDSIKSEGSYGVGDETYEGFNAFKVTDAKGNTLFDTLNSDNGEVHVEYDEDGATAWDEIGRRNIAFTAACNPQTVLALLSRIEELEGERTEAARKMREALGKYCDGRADWLLRCRDGLDSDRRAQRMALERAANEVKLVSEHMQALPLEAESAQPRKAPRDDE